MNYNRILLDTSVLIRLFNKRTGYFHEKATFWFDHLFSEKRQLKLSTIVIAEYCVCVDSPLENLPMKNFYPLNFKMEHAQRAGEFARILFSERKKNKSIEKKSLNRNIISNDVNIFDQARNIISNDVNIFAQADVEENISHLLTFDKKSIKMFNILKEKLPGRVNFDILSDSSPPQGQKEKTLFSLN